MERRFESDRHTIMPPNFFVCHALEEGQDWRAFMAGIATYPNFMVAWWDVDTVNLIVYIENNIVFLLCFCIVMFLYCDVNKHNFIF